MVALSEWVCQTAPEAVKVQKKLKKKKAAQALKKQTN